MECGCSNNNVSWRKNNIHCELLLIFLIKNCPSKSPYRNRIRNRQFLVLGLIAAIAVISACDTCVAFSVEQKTVDNECHLSPELIAEIRSYQPIVNRIVSAAVKGPFSGKIYDAYVKYNCKLIEPTKRSNVFLFEFICRLDELVDRFGPRMEGTPALENAIDFVVEQMKAAGYYCTDIV